MSKIIISDTSCLIVLSKIGELDLLKKMFGKIVTTYEIADEYGEELPDWIEKQMVIDVQKQQLITMQVDKGEASAIALAIENKGSLLILDDYKARRLADQLEQNYTGTIGIIVSAKQKGIIPSIKPLIEKIKQTNFHISVDLELKALLEAGE